MSVSGSKKGESLDSTRNNGENADRMSLSALRSQFTKSTTQTLSQSEMTSARFRNEERLRSDIRRERRLRQQAINERVIAMQENLAKELAAQHELTIDALEKQLREQMEQELTSMEKKPLFRKSPNYGQNMKCVLIVRLRPCKSNLKSSRMFVSKNTRKN